MAASPPLRSARSGSAGAGRPAARRAADQRRAGRRGRRGLGGAGGGRRPGDPGGRALGLGGGHRDRRRAEVRGGLGACGVASPAACRGSRGGSSTRSASSTPGVAAADPADHRLHRLQGPQRAGQSAAGADRDRGELPRCAARDVRDLRHRAQPAARPARRATDQPSPLLAQLPPSPPAAVVASRSWCAIPGWSARWRRAVIAVTRLVIEPSRAGDARARRQRAYDEARAALPRR